MTASVEKVHICGRMRGVAGRRLQSLSAAAGVALTRGTATADTIVLTHGAARRVVSDEGALRLSFAPKPGVRLMSERAFRRRLGLEPALTPDDLATHSEDQLSRHSGLGVSQLRVLALFDVLSPIDGAYTYADLVAARAVGQLHASGVKIPKIVAAAAAFERRGKSLASVRLAEAPWGEVLQVLEGALAGVDGQLLLPLEGRDIDADGAFALAEASEEEGDLDAARRWYELALPASTRQILSFPSISATSSTNWAGRARRRSPTVRRSPVSPTWRTPGSIWASCRTPWAGTPTRWRVTPAPS